MNTRTGIHEYTRAYTQIHLHTPIYTHIHTQTCMNTRTYTHILVLCISPQWTDGHWTLTEYSGIITSATTVAYHDVWVVRMYLGMTSKHTDTLSTDLQEV